MAIPLIILAGSIGSGKSTIGPLLANQLNFTFIESDSFASETIITKWASGIIPEDDDDRWDWYDRSVSKAFHLEKQSSIQGIIFECAAPKKLHRDRLRMRIQYLKEQGSKFVLYFIFCTVLEEESSKRVQKRRYRSFNALANFVAPQYAILEIPKIEGPDMEENIYLLDCNGAIEDNVSKALKLIETNIVG